METQDFIFNGDYIKAKRLFKGHQCLFPTKKKRTSDISKPPKPIKSQKGEIKGLVATRYRASNQVSPGLCPSKLIAAKCWE